MKKLLIVMIVIVFVFGLSVAAAAAVASPGTEADPVVTKSYVDAQIATVSSGSSQTGTYQVVQMTTGQKMLGKAGAEIIVRSGETTAIDNGANGVSDITAGLDLMTGTPIGLNHLLLIPKEDGRGIQANTEAFIMVRGSYTIQ